MSITGSRHVHTNSNLAGQRLLVTGHREFGPYDAQVVRDAQARRVSWQNIAKMLGAPLPDVRRHFDPTYIPAHPVRPKLDLVPTAKGEDQRPLAVRAGTLEHKALYAFAEALGEPVSPFTISKVIDRSYDQTRDVLGSLAGKGCVILVRPGQWKLTKLGLRELERTQRAAAAHG